MLDLNAIYIFVHVVEANSFSAAGRLLSLPKSTVSRKVQQLEEQLNVRLLQRSTRSLALTEQGQQFYQRCQRMVLELKEAQQEIENSFIEPQGNLKISMPVEEGHKFLGEILPAYMQQYPKVNLQVELSNDIVDLIEGGYDLAIRAGTLVDSSLIAIKLFDERMVAYAHVDYIEQYGEPSLDNLSEHHVLVYGSQGQYIGYPELLKQSPLVINNFEILKQMVMSGNGIALLPEHYCQHEVEQGELVNVLPEWSQISGGLYVVYPHRKLLTPKIKTFIDHLKDFFTT